ncbi:piggyBac transposable element-derived protein 2-like [Ischnura elegans]|uniref:piggyBac transposable element-derived protein 2-like n=1 Tax=Ischnura elegans TaxID=197161 RepID=UPI001ED87E8A|nr:piggyBac transposable element-derived protein 2-like [Ischnura elegans]
MSFLSFDYLSDEQIVNILISDGDTSDLENLSDDEDAVHEVAVIDQEGGDHEDNPSDDNDVDVYEIINLPEDIPGPSTSKASSSSTREKRSTSQRQNRERSASSSQGTSESHQSSQAPRQPPNPDPAVRKEIFNSLNLTDRKSISWTKGPLDSHAINFYELPPKEVTSLPSPYDYFQRYITDDLVQDMVEKTNLYATRTNVANFPPVNEREMKVFIGVNLAMGIFNYPQIHLFWNQKFSIPLILDNISRNRFHKIRQAFHVTDVNEKPANSNDRFWKIRPIYESIRAQCKNLDIEPNLCVDEQMIGFKGQINVKQFIKNKPTKWGIKVFALCGESGTVYDFILYQGSSTEIQEKYKDFGLGPSVVMQLAERIDQKNCRLYFDNYFSSYHLFQYLLKKDIYAIGTIRINRFSNPPLTDDPKVKKNQKRGYAEEVRSNDGSVVITKWLDNNTVNVGSNYKGIGTMDKCKRWDRATNAFIEIDRPECIRLYNESMGGVDKCDFLLAIYKTKIRTRKWTLRMANHAFDLAVVNSWLNYRSDAEAIGLPKNKILDLLAFRLYVAESLVLCGSTAEKKRGRPSNCPVISPTVPKRRKQILKPIDDIRFDNVGHFPEFKNVASTGRCKNPGCKSKTYIICTKCNINLCCAREKNCFHEYHVKK